MIYQAITTKYIPATDNHCSRVKAICSGGSVTIPYNCSLSETDAHKEAFVVLVKKMGWDKYTWHIGGLENGYVFVLAD